MRSSAISAESTALPRSIRTSTPSSDHARSIASITSTASVPIGWSGRSRPPAVSSRTSGPPISRASSATPSAMRWLCETMTMPTMAGSRAQALEASTLMSVTPYATVAIPRTSRPRATRRLALTESPKSKSTERRPSIAWVVTTTRNSDLDART